MEQNSHHKEALVNQIREAFGRITYSYTTHLKFMNRLILKNKAIKHMQIALSAISTGGFIGSLITNEFMISLIGGLIAAMLLTINLYYKDFKLFDEIELHRLASDKLWLIREQHISLLTDAQVLSCDKIVSLRDNLQIKTHEVYSQSPKTDEKSYAAAQKALKDGGEQHFTERELDKMLPNHLRKDRSEMY